MMILQKNRSVNNFFEIHEIDKRDSLQIEMLRNNSFEYIADCRFREVDNDMVMLCKIDGMSTLFSMIRRGGLQVREIMLFLFSLSECLKELQDYILSPEALIIDSRYILFDPGRGSFRFILVPGAGRDFTEQFKAVMEELLSVMDHSDRDNAMYIYDFFSVNVLRDNFTAEVFIRTMDRMAEAWRKPPMIEKSPSPEAAQDNTGYIGDSVDHDPAACINHNGNEYVTKKMNKCNDDSNHDNRNDDNNSPYHISANANERIKNIGLYCTGGVILSVGVIMSIIYGLPAVKLAFVAILIYTAVLINRILKTREEEMIEHDMNLYSSGYQKDGGDDSYISEEDGIMTDSAFTVSQLTESPVTKLVPVDISLLRADNQIFLLGDRLTVGRTSGDADYCLSVPGVSREHAELIRNGNSYMVNDLNSTNGTYVNSVRITGPTRLCYGDIVSFATVDFYCM